MQTLTPGTRVRVTLACRTREGVVTRYVDDRHCPIVYVSFPTDGHVWADEVMCRPSEVFPVPSYA